MNNGKWRIGTRGDDTIDLRYQAPTDVRDNAHGDAGDDVIYGNMADNVLLGGYGDDEINGGDGNDEMFGGEGNDVLDGTDAWSDFFDGGAGDDILIVGGSANDLVGGADHDIVDFNALLEARDVDSATLNLRVDDWTNFAGALIRLREVEELAFNDFQGELTVADDDESHVIRSGQGDDRLYGYGGDDEIWGGYGADVLIGGAGADYLRGGVGGGADWANYNSSPGGVDIDLTRATQFGADAEGDRLDSIENVDGSRYNDTLRGGNGANVLSGGLGNDVIEGRGGSDTIDGGTHYDTASYESSPEAVFVRLGDPVTGAGASASGGHAAGDTLVSIEALVGSRYNDELTGNADDNRIDGQDGVDVLHGGGGNDWLSGGFAGDIVDGGSGTDTVDYGFATDYAFATFGVFVQLGMNGADGRANADQSSLFGSMFEDILRSVENVNGSPLGDTIYGNEQANTLSGLDGDDYIVGGLGADMISGGAGIDAVDYADSPVGITIAVDGSAGIGGTAAGDRLYGVEIVEGTPFGDAITGNSAANTLEGRGGSDTLIGGWGADVLDGGSAADRLTGGAHADTFVWRSTGETGLTTLTADLITDFDFADGDRIDLSQIDANVYADGNQTFRFIGQDPFTLDVKTPEPNDVIPGEIRYYHSGNETIIQLQTGVDADIEGLIRIAGIHTPTADWFVR
jgi:Ca2+-binding RTX toxin-like protein